MNATGAPPPSIDSSVVESPGARWEEGQEAGQDCERASVQEWRIGKDEKVIKECELGEMSEGRGFHHRQA